MKTNSAGTKGHILFTRGQKPGWSQVPKRVYVELASFVLSSRDSRQLSDKLLVNFLNMALCFAYLMCLYHATVTEGMFSVFIHVMVTICMYFFVKLLNYDC